MIEEFLKSKVGIAMLSIIWGLGLATLFRRSCDGSGCKIIEFRGPPINLMKSHHWVYDNKSKDRKCYKTQPYITSCIKS